MMNLRGLYKITEEVFKDLSDNRVPVNYDSLVNTMNENIEGENVYLKGCTFNDEEFKEHVKYFVKNIKDNIITFYDAIERLNGLRRKNIEVIEVDNEKTGRVFYKIYLLRASEDNYYIYKVECKSKCAFDSKSYTTAEKAEAIKADLKNETHMCKEIKEALK